MLSRSILALATSLVWLNAAAATHNYFVVVPAPGRTASAATPDINVTLGGAALPAGRVGVAYQAFDLKSLLTVTGDPKFVGYGVSWSVAAGELPAGLRLNSDGTISGVPTAGGPSSFSVKATYRTKEGLQAYRIVVASIAVALAVGAPPQAMVGTAYSYDLKSLLTVTGDNAYNGAGVTWSVTQDSLPAGLKLMSDGTISGTPTAAGKGTVTARATYQGVNGERAYQVVAVDITVELKSATIPSGKLNKSYAPFDFRTLLDVNGGAEYSADEVTFQASTGLPKGMELSASGMLSGTPALVNTAGSRFTVTANYKEKKDTQTYTFIVNAAVLTALRIATGNVHTCAVTTEGGAVCWGSNTYGQVGNNSTTSSVMTPVPVYGLAAGVIDVQTRGNHTCALVQGGGVKCWGQNNYGQLGNGQTTNSLIPVDVVGIENATQLTVGSSHTCVVTTDGAAKCWGQGTSNQLGTGKAANSSVPVDVAGLSANVSAISAGSSFTCAIQQGSAKCWGAGTSGQLGDGTNVNKATPTAVTGISSAVTSIAAGGSHTCALNFKGWMYCWGNNSYGQAGGTASTQYSTPQLVSGASNSILAITAGSNHTCAITTAGTAKCWGYNPMGALGNGNTSNVSTPTAVTGLSSGVAAVSAGNWHTCAILTTKEVKCWGANTSGQAGDGGSTGSYRLAPVFVAD